MRAVTSSWLGLPLCITSSRSPVHGLDQRVADRVRRFIGAPRSFRRPSEGGLQLYRRPRSVRPSPNERLKGVCAMRRRMTREAELLDPLAIWFRGRYGANGRLLFHEEPTARGGRRPDVLIVTETGAGSKVDDVLLVPVEVESSSHAALHDRRNGVQQLRKYEGHEKYLAIPETVARVRDRSRTSAESSGSVFSSSTSTIARFRVKSSRHSSSVEV